MANSTKKTKQLPYLTLGERIQVFEHRENNPKDSFETISKIFSEKFFIPEMKTHLKTVGYTGQGLSLI